MDCSDRKLTYFITEVWGLRKELVTIETMSFPFLFAYGRRQDGNELSLV